MNWAVVADSETCTSECMSDQLATLGRNRETDQLAGPLSQLDFANWVSPDNHIKCMITGPLGMSSIGEMHGKACMITGSLGMSSIGEMHGKSQLQHDGTESVLRPPTRPAPQLARHCIYSLLAVAVVCFILFWGTGAQGAQG